MSDFAVEAVFDVSRDELLNELRQLRTSSEQTDRKIEALGRQAQRSGQRVERMGRESRTAGREIKTLGREGAATATSMQGLGRLVGLISFGLVAREVIQMTDTMKQLRSQLRIVTDGEAELNRALDQTRQVALETRSSFEATVNLYARLTRATKSLNVSSKDVLTVTKAVNQSFQVSGATAQEAAAATIQLAQGLAAGALRGDEFRSVNEQAPRIMQALADSIGITRGQLRAMAFQGKLTADVVIKAMLDQSNVIQSEFDKVEVTVGQSTTNLATDMMQFVSDLDAATGASKLLIGTINTLSRAIEGLDSLVSSGLPSQLDSLVKQRDVLLAQFQDGMFGKGDAAYQKLQDLNAAIVDLQKKIRDAGSAGEEAGAQLSNGFKTALAAVDKELTKAEKKTATFKTGINDEIAVLRTRVSVGKQAADVEELYRKAQAKGLLVSRQWVASHVAERDALQDLVNQQKSWAKALEEVDKELTKAEKDTRDFKAAQQSETKVLQARLQGGEQAAKVEKLYQQAKKDGLNVSRQYIASQVAERAALQRRITDAQQAADEWRNIWQDAASSISDGFAAAWTTDILNQRRAKARAKEQLDQRLQDIQDNLDKGNIKQKGALDERKKAYDDYRKRIGQIDKSIADNMKTVMIDAFADLIKQLLSMWVKSGLTHLALGLANNELDLSGFGLATAFGKKGSAGGKIVQAGESKAVTTAIKKGYAKVAESLSLGSGAIATGGVTTLGGANTIAGVGGGISGVSVTGGAEGAGLGGGSGAAGGTGLAALAPAAALLAGYAIDRFVVGPSGLDKAVARFRGFQRGGALGTAVGTSADGKYSYIGGTRSGFARDFARGQGLRSFKITDQLQGIQGKGADMESTLKLLEQAEKKFKEIKKTAADAFKSTGLSARDAGKFISDGVIDKSEKAALGLGRLGGKLIETKSGVKTLGELSVQQFGRMTDAVNRGDLSLDHLQNTGRLTSRELQVLHRIGITTAEDLANGFDVANNNVSAFGNNATGALNNATNAAKNLANAINSIPAPPSVGGGKSYGNSGGGGGGNYPGKAKGGISTGPTSGYWELLHGTEAVIPLEGGRVPVRLHSSSSGDKDTRSLLQDISDRLAQMDRTALDEGSVNALAAAITGPIVNAQRRETRHADRRRSA